MVKKTFNLCYVKALTVAYVRHVFKKSFTIEKKKTIPKDLTHLHAFTEKIVSLQHQN